ncbi:MULTISPECIES: hypothetical protein [Halobacterium]|uniref:hypothetical protein n=1 Tax=Halobacterium TaxID=2239 RepID=UPI000AD754E0|nr:MULTISPECIES: hypothetical protein [Halobacterium]MCG1004880.1 hypothetical protein [Halobacterium noricense]
MSSDNAGSQLNAKRLLEDVHELASVLESNPTSGQPRAVPAHKWPKARRAQSRVENIIMMLQPVASDRDVWSEPFETVKLSEGSQESPSSSWGRSVAGTGLQPESGGGSVEEREVALNDIIGWDETVTTTESSNRRGMSNQRVERPACLSLSAIQSALVVIWEIINDLNLGIPKPDTRPENEMEWDIEEFEEE